MEHSIEKANHDTSIKPTAAIELKATVPEMLSDDYKERFRAEYSQLKIRWKRLRRYCVRIEAVRRLRAEYGFPDKKLPEEPPHDCPYELLMEQLETMGRYLHLLELRAVIEGVEL